MKKVLLGAFILFDVLLMAGSAFVLYTYLFPQSHRFPSLSPVTSSPAAITNNLSVGSSTSAVTAVAPASPVVSSGTQAKIFSYRNSRAKLVAIRADFTGWKAEPMLRDSAGVWTYKAILSPGEYAYCYSVDDKPPLKDPVNKRTKVIGRAVVSAIVVEAPLPKPPK